MRIYLFSPICYEFLHQRPQKLAEQFLAKGIPVTYIQPSGFTEYLSGKQAGLVRVLLVSLWYHLLGLLALILPVMRKKKAGQGGIRSLKEFEIIALPVTYPVNRVDVTFLELFTAAVYRQFLLRRVMSAEQKETVAIFQNPFWGRVIEAGDFSKTCYDCLDDVTLYGGNASPERFLDYEARLLRKADVVVTTASQLEDHLRARTSKPIYRIHRDKSRRIPQVARRCRRAKRAWLKLCLRCRRRSRFP